MTKNITLLFLSMFVIFLGIYSILPVPVNQKDNSLDKTTIPFNSHPFSFIYQIGTYTVEIHRDPGSSGPSHAQMSFEIRSRVSIKGSLGTDSKEVYSKIERAFEEDINQRVNRHDDSDDFGLPLRKCVKDIIFKHLSKSQEISYDDFFVTISYYVEQ